MFNLRLPNLAKRSNLPELWRNGYGWRRGWLYSLRGGPYHYRGSNVRVNMDIEHFGTAKVVKALVECVENLREAMSGAQMAHDEPLFGRLYKKQTEIYEMIAELVKPKQERPNA